MPSYIIPPWLRPPPDPGEQYIQAYGQGANEAASARAAAAQQQRLQMEQANSERDYLMRQQQFEIAKQQAQLEFGLKQQELQQQQALAQAQIKEYAQTYAARQKYQELVAGGMDPIKATMMAGPSLFPSAAGWGQVVNPRAQAGAFTPAQRVAALQRQLKIVENSMPDRAAGKAAMQPGETEGVAAQRLKQEEMDRLNKQIRYFMDAQLQAASQGISTDVEQMWDPDNPEEAAPQPQQRPQAQVPKTVGLPPNRMRVLKVYPAEQKQQ